MTDPNTPPPASVVAEALERVASPDWARFAEQLHHTGGCAQPVRLKGTLRHANPDTGELTVAYTTDGEPDEVLLKACGTRRATRCPACAGIYRGDARALILAGLLGGKTAPDTVKNAPVVFVTLTAPSFGAVHQHRDGMACRAQPAGPCPHGRSHRCDSSHRPDDPKLGMPICPQCYDLAGTIIFNLSVTDLWGRTTVALRRGLAAEVGTTTRAFARHHSLNYVKVVEYQQRGAVHLHALLRVDPAPGSPNISAGQLARAAATAIAAAHTPHPLHPGQTIRWGTQNDIIPVATHDRQQVAAYLAKYTTKSTDRGGALDHRLHHLRDLERHPRLETHLAALVTTAWTLADHPKLAGYHLRRWAHTLGYRGHWITKSRAWSTTFTQLRAARHQWQQQQHGHTPHDNADIALGQWTYAGSGHQTDGDTWLAQSTHHNRQLNRRTAWEERP